MASKIVKELEVLIKTVGAKKAREQIRSLNTSMGNISGQTDRANKGVAGFTSNATKGFAKQAQGLGGLVRLYATVAANVFALSAAFNKMREVADFDILIESTRELSVQSGRNLLELGKQLKEITKGALNYKDAIASANLATTAGLSGEQLKNITTIATKAAQSLGRSVPEAVNRLTQAIVKGEPELADEFGIILRLEKATKAYAESVNKSAKELTAFERQQAIYNQFAEQGAQKTEGVTIKINEFDQAAATFTDTMRVLLGFLRSAVGPVFSFFGDNITAMGAAIFLFATKLLSAVIPSLTSAGVVLAEKMRASATTTINTIRQAEQELDRFKKKYAKGAGARADIATSTVSVLKHIQVPQFAKLRKAYREGIISTEEFNTKVGTLLSNTKTKVGKAFADINTQINTYKKNMGAVPPGKIFKAGSLELAAKNVKILNEAITESKKKIDLTATGFNALKIRAKGLVTSFRTAGASIKVGFTTAVEQATIKGNTLAKTLAQVDAQLTAVGRKRTGLNTFISSAAYGITKFGGMLVNLVMKFTMFTAVLSIVYGALTSIARAFGWSNESFKKATETLNKLEKAQLSLIKSIDLMKDSFTKAESLRDLESHFTKVANITDQLSENFGKLSEATGQLADAGWWDRATDAMIRFITTLGGLIGDGRNKFEILEEQAISATKTLWETIGKDAVIEVPIAITNIAEVKEELAAKYTEKDVSNLQQQILKQRRNINKTLGTEVSKRLEGGLVNLNKRLKEMQANVRKTHETISIAFGKETEKIGMEESVKRLNDILAMADDTARTIKLREYLESLQQGSQQFSITNKTLSSSLKEVQNQFTNLENSYKDIKVRGSATTRFFADQVNSFGNLESAINKTKNSLKEIGGTKYLKELKKILGEELKEGSTARTLLGIAEGEEISIDAILSKITAFKDKYISIIEQERTIKANTRKTAAEIRGIEQEISKTTGDRSSLMQKASDLRTKDLKAQETYYSTIQNSYLEIVKVLTKISGMESLVKQMRANADAAGLKALTAREKGITNIAKLEIADAKEKVRLANIELSIAKERLGIIKTSQGLEDISDKLKVELKLQELAQVRLVHAEKIRTLEAKALVEVNNTALITLQMQRERINLLKQEETIRRTLIDLNLKEANDFSIKTLNAVGDKMQQIAKDFRKTLKSAGQQFVEAMTTGLDTVVDTFIDKLETEGIGGALKSAFEEANQAIADLGKAELKKHLKSYGRDVLAKLFGPSFKNAFKTEEEIHQKTVEERLQEIATSTEIIATKQCSCAGGTPTFGTAGAVGTGEEGDPLAYARESFARLGNSADTASEKVKDAAETQVDSTNIVSKAFSSLSDMASKASTSFMNMISGAFSTGGFFGTGGAGDLGGIVSGLGSLFSSGGGSAAAASSFDPIAQAAMSFAMMAKGGLASLNAYANGGITSEPELAIIGEGKNREAVVPLPDNRSIPVDLGDSGGEVFAPVINVTLNGVPANEAGINRSAQQLGATVSRVLQKSRRNM